MLREVLNLMGTKIGCEKGNCGTCTVLVDGKSIKSCLLLAVKAKVKEIVTIEGLKGKEGGLHPLQEAFMEPFCGATWILDAWDDIGGEGADR